jgi:hypothetical protein
VQRFWNQNFTDRSPLNANRITSLPKPWKGGGVPYSGSLRALIGIAGTPATVTPGGTSLVTTAFAPTVAPSPIVTPPRTVTPRPIHTSLPIMIGLAVCPDCRMVVSPLRWWFASRMLEYSPIMVPAPMVTPAMATM